MEYFTKLILLPEGWKRDVRLLVSPQGEITNITCNADSKGAEFIDGTVIPGMPNLHSHAFQRAMAGLAEYADSSHNDFWSWREAMYAIASQIGPEQLQVIATQLYMEMLKAGYTSVAEFHYLHHDKEGQPYAEPGEMSDRIITATADTGIGLTLLPVLYMTANFDGAPAQDLQCRFTHTVDTYTRLLDKLLAKQSTQLKVGAAFHSLRAVPEDALQSTLHYLDSINQDIPVHIHIAEQGKEIQDSIKAYGCTPVQWLLDHFPVDRNWCLIHATHTTPKEVTDMANSACVVGLCPTTEANLSDGIFPLKQTLDADGRFGIGSDSHISVSPIEELRWLEYGQRLTMQQRNIATSITEPHTGALLWQMALTGGAQALGRNINGLSIGQRADLLVLRDDHPLLAGKTSEYILDTLVFSGNESLVKDVIVGGQWLVTDGIHRNEDDITQAYKKTMNELFIDANNS